MSFTPGAGVVLSANSSSTLLTNGSVFTGAWQDVSKYDSVTVALKTDQDCSVSVQFSPDGTNPDSQLTTNYKTARINPPRRYTVGRRYFRVVVTNNSGSDQTYLRLQSLAGNKTQLNFPLDGTLSQNADAIVARVQDYFIDVSLGRREGQVNWHKWGYNSDIDTAAEETVWSAGGLLTPLTSAETLDCVSSSAADDVGSTGLEQIKIVGVGAGRIYQEETVDLNGTAAVTTSNTWLGVNRVSPVSSGSGLVNAGDITISASTAATTQAYIPAGVGVTQQAFFFVPAGRQFETNWLRINVNKISGGGSPVCTISGWVRNFPSGSRYLVFRETYDTSVDNSITIDPQIPFPIPASSLLEFTASTDVNNTIVNIRFAGVEIEDA